MKNVLKDMYPESQTEKKNAFGSSQSFLIKMLTNKYTIEEKCLF